MILAMTTQELCPDTSSRESSGVTGGVFRWPQPAVTLTLLLLTVGSAKLCLNGGIKAHLFHLLGWTLGYL